MATLASIVALPATAAAQNAPPATSWADQGWDTQASREGLLGGFHWNFESTDPKQAAMHDLIVKVRHIAWEFFPLALILGLIIEAFGRAPGQGRDLTVVVWRAIVVMFLLFFYVPIFNGLIVNIFDPLADKVTPVSGMGEFLDRAAKAAQTMPTSATAGSTLPQPPGSSSGGVLSGVTSKVGGFFYDSLVAFLLLVAEGLIIVLVKLGKILAALLFCIGPLALVAAIPRPSSTGTRWFGHFITVLSWPIFTGLLLSIMVAMGSEGAETTGYIAAVIASLLMGAIALSTPRLAAQVVGGTLENLMATGYRSAKDVQRDAVGGAKHTGSVVAHTAGAAGAAAGIAGTAAGAAAKATGAATALGMGPRIDPEIVLGAMRSAGSVASNPPGGGTGIAEEPPHPSPPPPKTPPARS
ncbi:hypothetical protein [Anaeromyxobacter oryzisoli]|uniref:hypothetical protein n=1 Tax=Anaeromyxobacter oryzisoli TaxID=2925408 RepID=UPI001F57F486|nr:hypothetical protein [Anaeromyxobacter sp. SG63]